MDGIKFIATWEKMAKNFFILDDDVLGLWVE